MKIVTLWISAFVYLNLTNGSFSQSAIEHHVWQDHRKFEAFSRTAVAITGSINLSGNSFFAKPGSTMKMTFANGKSVKLTLVLAAWRHWSDIDGNPPRN